MLENIDITRPSSTYGAYWCQQNDTSTSLVEPGMEPLPEEVAECGCRSRAVPGDGGLRCQLTLAVVSSLEFREV